MSYHDQPHHRKSKGPEGQLDGHAHHSQKSRQVSVLLKGGPRDGDAVTYGQPLPKTLVVASDQGYQDYERKPNTTTYIHKFDMNVKREETVADSIGLPD